MSASSRIRIAGLCVCLISLVPRAVSADATTGVESDRGNSALSASPNIDALPSPAQGEPVDLESVAKGYESLLARDPAAVPAGLRLLVFVSFAMPQPALRRLVDQAADAHATRYLRGLVGGSLKETVARVQPLLANRSVALQIDPRAFDRFAIVTTPSFVLVRAGTDEPGCADESCTGPEAFAKVAGDVSLDYALDFMQRAAPDLAATADAFLMRLKR